MLASNKLIDIVVYYNDNNNKYQYVFKRHGVFTEAFSIAIYIVLEILSSKSQKSANQCKYKNNKTDHKFLEALKMIQSSVKTCDSHHAVLLLLDKLEA